MSNAIRMHAKNRLNPVKQVEPVTDRTKGAPSPGKTRYVLKGGIIEVLKTDKNGQEKCVGTIPLRAASLQILNQVECTNLMDAILLDEVKREKMGKPEVGGNYNAEGKNEDEPVANSNVDSTSTHSLA